MIPCISSHAGQDIKDFIPCGYHITMTASYAGTLYPWVLAMWLHDIQDFFQCRDIISSTLLQSGIWFIGRLSNWAHDIQIFLSYRHIPSWTSSHMSIRNWCRYQYLIQNHIHVDDVQDYFPCWKDLFPWRYMISRTASHVGIWYTWLLPIHIKQIQYCFLCVFNVFRTASHDGMWYPRLLPMQKQKIQGCSPYQYLMSFAPSVKCKWYPKLFPCWHMIHSTSSNASTWYPVFSLTQNQQPGMLHYGYVNT